MGVITPRRRIGVYHIFLLHYRLQGGKALNLHEIIDALQTVDDDVPFPSAVSILPPENANAEVTKKDSGDEDFVDTKISQVSGIISH